MAELVLILCGPGVLLFFLQLAVLRLIRTRFLALRFLTLSALLIPVALILQTWLEGGWFWQLGALLYAVMAGAMLFGWGLAWIGAPLRKAAEETEREEIGGV